MSEINIEKCLCFTANTNNSTISISINGTPTSESNFLYSRGTNWISITPGSSTITLRQGDKVYLKGNNPSGVSKSGGYYYFVMTGSISASGNIMSIIDNGRCTTTVIPGKECFFRMFKECTSLTTPPELPATTLKAYCYGYLFHNCSSLLVAPELPASISKSCYLGMFDGCTSLLMPPALPMTDLDRMCYNLMFLGCTSLVEAPELPATTLASTCYKLMFYGCTSLLTAPSLPATTLTDNCYWAMFYGCTSLTTAPELPATELADYCYRLMFLECSSLTTVPELPATTLAESCYDYMFNGCRSLVVSDSPGPAYNKAWTIPFLGTFTNTYSQAGMFTNCLTGSSRASNDMPGEAGQSYTYYTQNFSNPTLIAFKPGNYHNYKTKNIGGLSSYQLTAEDLSSTPTPKTSPGYVFVDGWYNESSCTTKAVVGQEINGPTTLHGKVLGKYLVDIRGEGDMHKNGIIQNARDYKLDTARKMLNDNIYIYAVTHDYDMGWELIE